MDQENNDARNDEIARLAAEGIPHAELAVRFGISRQRIGQIAARGKSPVGAGNATAVQVFRAAKNREPTARENNCNRENCN